ncbi:MAG: hypothetical protein QM808_05940 [Steroidobacteraceae bacterium]
MRTARLHAHLVAAALLASVCAHSEEVSVPAAPTGETAAATVPATPARGVTMNKVEAQFGAPTERHAAVGKPPITRWDYPGFSVFFEYNHVVHSVVR